MRGFDPRFFRRSSNSRHTRAFIAFLLAPFFRMAVHRRWQGFAEDVALYELDRHVLQHLDLGVLLDAFGDDVAFRTFAMLAMMRTISNPSRDSPCG